MKRKNKFFRTAGKTALGVAGVGVITGVGSSVATHAGMPGLSAGFNTISGFVPIGTTAIMGKAVLDETKMLNRKRKYY